MNDLSDYDQVYDVIYADPPWRYSFSKSNSRKIENQYSTMDLDDIKQLPIPSSPNSHLYLWATSPKLPEAMGVLDAWGYRYVTCGVWDKLMIGMGYYFRQQHELILIGTKGKLSPPAPKLRPSSVFRSKRQKHSKKPDIVREAIDNMYPNAKIIELFARDKFRNWDTWGNEGL